MGVKQGPVFFTGLNGIRALAAMGVLVSHTLGSTSRVGLGQHGTIQFAGTGVTIFFTLSGFLITYLLLREKSVYGRIDLRRFYLRRILRIWPLYFFYIGAAVLVTYVMRDDAVEYLRYLVFFVLFVPNIAFNLNRYPSDLGHLWSIGIEEQFYAFWPIVLGRITRVARFLIVLIAALVIARIGLKLYSAHIGNKLPFSLSICMRFDCMAIGALCAIAYDRSDSRLLRIARSPGVSIAFWAIVLVACLNRFTMFSFLGDDVAAVVTGLFIVRQVDANRPNTVLENRFASFLGLISFGLYVYHPLLISVVVHFVRRSNYTFAHPVVFVGFVAGLTIAVAWASHRWLEAPFLRLKERFARIESSRSPSNLTASDSKQAPHRLEES